jgi:phage baseplate assembly protein W
MANKTRTFVDIDASFMANPVTGDIAVRTDDQAIKFAVRSLIMTNYYERPFRSNIGSPVNALMFENMGPNFKIILKQSIIDVISNFEPRVDVVDVVVDDSPDNNRVYISIIFKIKNTERPIEVGLTLTRTR